MNDLELKHWGVKGMKWGVRRYQNADGSLTAAGKKRYNKDYESQARNMSDSELRSQINRMNLERRYMDLSRSGKSKVSGALDVTDKAANVGSGVKNFKTNRNMLKGKTSPGTQIKGDIAGQSLSIVSKSAQTANKIADVARNKNDAKRSRAKLSSMSDQDLKETVNRMDMERQYANLKRDTVERGKVNVTKVLEITGDVVQVGASAVMIAVGIKKLLV